MKRSDRKLSRTLLPTVLGVALLATLAPATVAPVVAQEPLPIAVGDAFEVSGDAAADDTLYAWTIGTPGGQWSVEVSGPPDEQVQVELLDAEMMELQEARASSSAILYDLALDVGDYFLRVRKSPRDTLPFTLSAELQTQLFDPEPNDASEQASPIVVGTTVAGRLARPSGDADRYRLDVEAGAVSLLDIHLDWEAKGRRLCLLGTDDRAIQCRSGDDGAELLDLALDPGEYFVEVQGGADPGIPYELSVEAGGERRSEYEAEPNDTFETASSFDAAVGVTGRSDAQDPDFLVVTVEGEPQLWQVELSGPEIDRLSWVRGDGGEVAASTGDRKGSGARLDDLYLAPGSHVFRVRTIGADYALRLKPLGLPDPEAEREPNSDDLRAEPYQLGERKVGRLASDEDIDYFRFTLAAPEHIRLRLDQPADADIDVRLWSGKTQILRQWAAEPGQPMALDLALRAGDYLVVLHPRQASVGTYELTTERLDPFKLIADQEPNDDRAFARPAPRSLRWQGDAAGGRRDFDGYWLPALSQPGPITIAIEAEKATVRMAMGSQSRDRVELVKQEDGTLLAADPPLEMPLYLEIEAGGPYDIALDAPGWSAQPEPVDLAVEVALELEGDVVAAYWPEGQSIEGVVTIANSGTVEVDLDVSAVSSDYAWKAVLETETVRLAAGANKQIPIAVEVWPDVWADAPVRVSVAARSPDGAAQTASAMLSASRDAIAARSQPGWRVPHAMLGGLNVAGLALGAEPTGLVDAERERFLFDDVTPAGGGFGKGGLDFPVDLSVDLAGESPVPVAGIILNPLAGQSLLTAIPRDFELLLSTDGETWTSALSAELQPSPIDQSFVLDEPMLATHALLRVKTLQVDRSASLSLGEWKVIAVPGVKPDPMPDNIAAPVRGGYVARHAPFVNGFPFWYAMLDDDVARRAGGIVRDVDEEFEVVIGFQDGRAAQITGFRWRDPDESKVETRIDAVDVEVSTDGPLGPWQDAGSWMLDRDASGSVAPLELLEPTWARYVRLSSPLPPDVREVEFPATIEVIERTTDAEYRSILGEWGYTSRSGPFEWLVASASGEVEVGPDAGNTPADATPLAAGTTRSDRVEILADVDWYRIEVPAGRNTLTVDLEGVPSVGVRLSLFGVNGDSSEMRMSALPGGAVRYEAIVEPGRSYDVLVEQPPFNAVFTFDTSGSMGPFLDFVFEGMREFAADVEPGREAVMIVPFERSPLLDVWQDQPILLENAFNTFVAQNESSDIERGLLASAQLLSQRDGTRAILVVADAETGSLNLAPDVWAAFEEVRPIVYTVHVGASQQPEETRNLMRAWADGNGGVYAYPTTQAGMQRAFERMSTRLRRPATYTIEANTTEVNRDPAQLSVVAPIGQAVALAPGVAVEIILDTSGSMREKIQGKPRIDIAKASLRELVKSGLAEGVPMAIRTFGGKGKSKAARCRTRLSLPLQPLEAAGTIKLIDKFGAERRTKTPIAAALAAVAADLADVTGSRTVVLVTDGDETCGGDPAAVIEELRATGIDINLNIVGFALDDQALKAQMAAWAEAGDGTYFDAGGAADLSVAISAAVSAPFRVYETAGVEPRASGTVGGGAVTLEPGTYRVEVLTDPPVEFEEVIIEGGANVSLSLPPAEDT